jgi:2-dehydropantoate 2-reductase
MGGSIGGVLVKEGWPVVFVDRAQEHVQAMNERGLQINGPISEFRVAVRAARPEDLQGSFATIFLCVKAHHTREALAQLEPHLAQDGAIVSIQNGLCELEIAEAVGSERTVGAFVLDGHTSPRVQDIHELLRLFEPEALLSFNIFGYLWGKLAYAALLFATAVTDASIADVLASKPHRPLLIALAREVVAVADARGVSLEGFDGFEPDAFHGAAPDERAEASLDELVAFNRRSAKTHSGIWRDLVVRKRPTEVDAQLGAVVRLAREVGVATPLTERLVLQIHEIEQGMREHGWSNLEELT